MQANRPVGIVDLNFRVDPNSFNDQTFRGQYDVNNNLIYKGLARAGAGEGDEVWQIAQLTYDGNNNLTSLKWPLDAYGRPSTAYTFAWSDRASYTYG